MTLQEYADTAPLDAPLEVIAVKCPTSDDYQGIKEGEKVYIVSDWISGVWVKKNINDTKVYPLQWSGDLGDLEIFEE